MKRRLLWIGGLLVVIVAGWVGFVELTRPPLLWHLPTLTVEQARSLVADAKYDLNLWELTSLPPDVAAVLAAFEGRLNFQRLQELSPEAAEALAAHKRELEFHSLKTLSPAAAAALARHDGILEFYGLATLSPEAAEALVPHDKAWRSRGWKPCRLKRPGLCHGMQGRCISRSEG